MLVITTYQSKTQPSLSIKLIPESFTRSAMSIPILIKRYWYLFRWFGFGFCTIDRQTQLLTITRRDRLMAFIISFGFIVCSSIALFHQYLSPSTATSIQLPLVGNTSFLEHTNFTVFIIYDYYDLHSFSLLTMFLPTLPPLKALSPLT